MMLPYNTLVVLSGVGLLGASAGMVGAFAVLRKRSLTGDALAHAALPGLCIAFLLLGERNLTAMLLGALASGVLGNMVIAALVRWTRVKEDAAIGTVLGGFFGLGVVLVTGIQHMSSTGSKAGLDSYILGKTAGMTAGDVYLILAASVACLAVVLLLFKEFKLIAFDGDFARSLGWPVYGLDLLLMTLVAVAVVIGLPAVGVVLMAALLIMPAAAARFWTERLGRMLALSGAFGLAIGVIGTSISATFAVMPAGPIIVLTGTAFFLVSMLAGTKRGVVAQSLRHRKFRRDLAERRLLRAALEVSKLSGNATFTRDDLRQRFVTTSAELERALDDAIRHGAIELCTGGTYRLSSEGKLRAVEIARGHRLWEALLVEYPELASSVADLGSVSITPHVPSEVVEDLTARLRAAGEWPELAP
jgi:manganese/zinc/iron transport system permease protein